MTTICLVLRAHQPTRLNRIFPRERARRIAEGSSIIDRYFDLKADAEFFTKASHSAYTPIFSSLLQVITEAKAAKTPVVASGSFTGLFLEQASRCDAALLGILRKLSETGRFEVLGGTFYNSLASIYADGTEEFKAEIREHKYHVEKLFGSHPAVFANTGCIYNDSMAHILEEEGFKAALVDNSHVVEAQSPEFVYGSKGTLKLLIRHAGFSDDMMFRFSEISWSEYPLTAEKLVQRLSNAKGDLAVLLIELDMFSGVWLERFPQFIKELASEVSKTDNVTWSSTSSAVDSHPVSGTIHIPPPTTISSDQSGDLTPWLGNEMQKISFDRMVDLGHLVREINHRDVYRIWRLLQQSDHLFYMQMDGNQAEAHSPFSSPAEAYLVFESILSDFEGKIATLVQRARKAKEQVTPTPVNTSQVGPSYKIPTGQRGQMSR